MIRIEITDPQDLDGAVLLSTARFLMQLAGHDVVIPTQDPVFNGPKHVDSDPGQERTEREKALEEAAEIAAVNKILENEEKEREKNRPVPLPPKIEPAFNPFAKPADPNLDASGVRWDSAVHTRTRSKTADGNWKFMRGLPPEKAEEFLGKVAPLNFNKDELVEPTPIDGFVEAAAVIPPPPVVVPPPPSVLDTPLDREAVNNVAFAEIVTKITHGTTTGRFSKAQVFEHLEDLGIGTMVDIMEHPEHFVEVERRLIELLK